MTAASGEEDTLKTGLRSLAEFKAERQPAGPRSVESAREHWVWLALGSLLAGLWALYSYVHLIGLHFAAWQLMTTRPSTNALAQNLRGPIMGWMEVVVVLLGFGAGGSAALAAVRGVMKPAIVYFAAMTLMLVAMEATQGLGQNPALPRSVDIVPISGVVLMVAIVAVAVLSLWMAVVALRNR